MRYAYPVDVYLPIFQADSLYFNTYSQSSQRAYYSFGFDISTKFKDSSYFYDCCMFFGIGFALAYLPK